MNSRNRSFFTSKLSVAGLLCLLVAGVGATAIDRIVIGQFSSGTTADWESTSFVGETQYDLVQEGSRTVLSATSNGTASGLGKKIKIDLRKTPYVNWSWKVDQGINNVDEKSKEGDDFAARLYVVKSGGALLWKTKALNYVWSATQPRGENWPNPYKPKNSIMFAVRGIEDMSGEWVTEKRNVREDLQATFGKDFTSIDAIAIMTDTDNTGGSARASYGDIFFSAE